MNTSKAMAWRNAYDAIYNMIANLENGSFQVHIMDDGEPRDASKENVENLKRVLEDIKALRPE